MNHDSTVEILLVEDDPHDMELALRALKKANIANSIKVVRDGAEALEFVFCEGQFSTRRPARPPKVILLDLKMPKKNGLEVLQWIRHHPRLGSLTVIMLTSSIDHDDIEKSKKFHVVKNFVSKPLDTEKIRSLIGS